MADRAANYLYASGARPNRDCRVTRYPPAMDRSTAPDDAILTHKRSMFRIEAECRLSLSNFLLPG